MSKLESIREARGWRKEDLAARSGLSLSTIANLETAGAGRPSRITTRRAIVEALGVPEDEIWPPDAGELEVSDPEPAAAEGKA